VTQHVLDRFGDLEVHVGDPEREDVFRVRGPLLSASGAELPDIQIREVHGPSVSLDPNPVSGAQVEELHGGWRLVGKGAGNAPCVDLELLSMASGLRLSIRLVVGDHEPAICIAV
jgi:hypothetical protein